MAKLTLEMLIEACRPGGGSVLTFTTELGPAAGESAGIAPARFVRGKEGTYAFETRFESTPDGPGRAVRTVVIDGKGSSLNRVEAAINAAIDDGHPVLSRVPESPSTTVLGRCSLTSNFHIGLLTDTFAQVLWRACQSPLVPSTAHCVTARRQTPSRSWRRVRGVSCLAPGIRPASLTR